MKRLSLFFALILLIFSTSTLYSEQLYGWKEKNGYYRPFVRVKNPKGKIVLFITPNGKVYKGRCTKGGYCYPRKKFLFKTPLRFIVINLNGSIPEVVRTGVIGD